MSEPITEWLRGLRHGEAEAAQKLWQHYAQNLEVVARARLGTFSRTVVDEEDIAQSVFSSICRGAAAGRFDNVNSRDELWWLLLAITKQKAVNYIRRETRQIRGSGRVRCEAQIGHEQGGKAFRLDELVGADPAPDFVAMLDEEYQKLLNDLGDDCLRQIAGMRLEGYEVSEVARKLGVSLRTVERKLMLIRARWSKLLPQ